MNATQTIEHLLKHFYRRFQDEEVVQQYGITPWQLTDSSGIYIGDGGAQLSAVERMINKGWVKIINRRLTQRVKVLLSSDNIQLTEEGIKEAERLLSPFILRHLRNFFVAIIEAFFRAKS